MNSRIFLDSGDPKETETTLGLLGFLDGQTTNPSLIAKNPETAGKKFSKEELLGFYKKVVEKVSALIPQGSVSIEVYADKNTTAEEMLKQAREFNAWIPSYPPSGHPLPPGERGGVVAHIKYPTTTEGLKAAAISVKEGIRVNMTLCFTQEQAAAVHAATRGAKKGDVFVSPFVGRLDDRGENGMDLIKNIMEMYKAGNSHVEVLTASVRSVDHMKQALALQSDIITAPLKVLKQATPLLTSPTRGAESSFSFPPPGGEGSREGGTRLTPIPYQQIDLNKPWSEYNLQHDLTDKGIERFSADWNALIA